MRVVCVWAALAFAGSALAYVLSAEGLDSVLAHNSSKWINIASPDSLLSRILVPRVSGTPENAKVRDALAYPFQHSKDKHGRAKWHVEMESFEASTPLGMRNFTNIVVTRDPYAARKLVLAAHYDSKYYPPGSAEEGFVGATDSAFPCSMLVDVAMALDTQLDGYTANHTRARQSHLSLHDDITLQLIFFDGEEAFQRWTATDSIYGARHLATQWADTWDRPPVLQNLQARHLTREYAPVRRIHTISDFVLFDLLGKANLSIPYYFGNTQYLHAHFAAIEERLLHEQKLWPPDTTYGKLLRQQRGPMGIADDHVPFLRQGVPVLHMIPYPFPDVWHTKKDDASALDQATMYAWARLVRVFTAEYLGLS